MDAVEAKRDFVSPVSSLLSYPILLGGLATIAFSAYLVVVSYSSLPYWDGWTQISYAVHRGNPSTLDWLWKQHNDHRMPIPKLFLLADLYWFHARQVFLLSSIFVVQFLQLLLVGWSMRVLGGWRGALWRTGTGLAAFCVFAPSQWENLVWGFQICFVLPGLCAAASFVGLLLYWKRSGEVSTDAPSNWKYLLLSIAAGWGATWSLSNGNLLWPMLVAAALLLRLRWAAVLSLTIAGAVSTAAYLHNYDYPSFVVPSVKSPLATIEYLGAYFGSSWVSSGHYLLAELLGIAGLVVASLLALRWPSCVRSRSPFCLQLILIALFCLGTGVITALGRSVLGISQAFSSRYQTVSLLFWCCQGLLLLGMASSLRRLQTAAIVMMQVILLAVMLEGAKHAEIHLLRARLHGFRLNAAAMSLVTNVPDPDLIQWAYWNSDYLFTLVPDMRQERLSVFAEPDPWLLGMPLDRVFGLASPIECNGEVESKEALGEKTGRLHTLRITGWAWDYKHRPPSRIVAASGGIIIGLGAMGDWRRWDKATRPWMTTNYIGYTGYVQEAGRGQVEIYAILHSNPATACLIATVK